MTLDKQIKELESITEKLAGTTGFDEAVALYKQGIDLAAVCAKQLDTVQQDVTVLSEQNGTLIERILTNEHH